MYCEPIVSRFSIITRVPIDFPARPVNSPLGVIFGSTGPQTELHPRRCSRVLAAQSGFCGLRPWHPLDAADLCIRLVYPSHLDSVHQPPHVFCLPVDRVPVEIVGCVAWDRYLFDLRVVVIGYTQEPVIRLDMRCVFTSPFLVIRMRVRSQVKPALPDLSHLLRPTW